MKAKRRPSKQPLFTHRKAALFWVGAIAALLIILLLMRQALNILGDGGQYWKETELNTAISRFNNTVALAHAEWIRQGRAANIELEVGEGPDQKPIVLRMSEYGWPLPTGAEAMNDQQCLALWQELLADLRLQLKLTADWQSTGAKHWRGDCNFYNNRQLKFIYSLHNGQLLHVNIQN
ncbi:hypothetical protein CWE09_08270 [Aliidiomarina minuta]|uniref:MSHA biogenesis protein MshF n=1 Tax=Aliidiomarina minuta TaxID=880057 RepID=A0A432W9F4_9GAMM|nr:hypothetical protein [Aliidiomarina minuta]RUO26681.1 hypothetical protein CWE09_08270 [Aliidiomarina minuta]